MDTTDLADGLIAENARLRARAENAEGQVSALRAHNTRWQTEKTRADQAERELEDARINLTTAQLQLADERAHSKRAYEELAAANAKLHQVAMVKVWTNEDGKRFVFADDLTDVLLPEHTGQRRENTTAGTT